MSGALYGKTFECQEPRVVLQISAIFKEGSREFVKAFLIIDATPGKFGVTVSQTKPDSMKPGGVLVTTMRKLFPTGVIESVEEGTITTEEKSTTAIRLSITAGKTRERFYIFLTKNRPPDIAITDPQQVLVRKSTKGSYTRRSPFTHEFVPTETVPLFELFEKSGEDELDEADESASQTESSTLPEVQRSVRDKVARRLKTLKKSLKQHESRLTGTSDLQRLKTEAKMLQQYIYLIKEGSFSITLESALTGLEEDLVLDLDPELGPGSNVEARFIELKRREKTNGHVARQIKKTEQLIDHMASKLAELRAAPLTDQEVRDIAAQFDIKLDRQSSAKSRRGLSEEAKPFKIYDLGADQPAFVGKGPKENDILTKKARSNDTWIHVVEGSGSHVVLPVQKKNQDPAPDLIRQAAILALHFSKKRTNMAGEVYVTRRHSIRKQKGLPPGLWLVDQAQTLFVKYDEKELKTVLDKLNA